MNKRRVIGILLIAICAIAVLFGNAGMEAIFPSVIFCAIGVFLIFKKPKTKKEKITNRITTNVNTKDANNLRMSAKELPKCNCDGCPKQENCEYGHVIIDEITGERLTLADKFSFLHAFDNYEPSGDEYTDIATIEERHHQKKLLVMDESKLLRTLEYLDKQKKMYYEAGKCGRAYYSFMNMGAERKLVWETFQYKRKELKNHR